MIKKRIFIAINLSDGVKKKLADWQIKCLSAEALAKAENKINWVRKENLHITLIFIGYVTDDETYKICKTVKEVAKKHQQFYINLERIITGPTYAKAAPFAEVASATKAESAGKPPTPRMFWVEGEKSQELANLQMDLENALNDENNYKKEIRPFRPHITLARFTNQVAKILPEINDVFNSSISVDSIDVMQSVLHRTGPEYTILERVELEGNEN